MLHLTYFSIGRKLLYIIIYNNAKRNLAQHKTNIKIAIDDIEIMCAIELLIVSFQLTSALTF